LFLAGALLKIEVQLTEIIFFFSGAFCTFAQKWGTLYFPEN
jgi:hypothetical protein